MKNPFRESIEVGNSSAEGFRNLLMHLFSTVFKNIGHILNTIYSHELYEKSKGDAGISNYLSSAFGFVGKYIGLCFSYLLLIPAAVGYALDCSLDYFFAESRFSQYHDTETMPFFQDQIFFVDQEDHPSYHSFFYRGFFGRAFGLLPASAELIVCMTLAVPVFIIDTLGTIIADLIDGTKEMAFGKYAVPLPGMAVPKHSNGPGVPLLSPQKTTAAPIPVLPQPQDNSVLYIRRQNGLSLEHVSDLDNKFNVNEVVGFLQEQENIQQIVLQANDKTYYTFKGDSAVSDASTWLNQHFSKPPASLSFSFQG